MSHKTGILAIGFFAAGFGAAVALRTCGGATAETRHDVDATADASRRAAKAPQAAKAKTDPTAEREPPVSAEEVERLRARAERLQREWDALPETELPDHVNQGGSAWLRAVRQMRELKASDPAKYQEEIDRGIAAWMKGKQYLAEELDRLDSFKDDKLTKEEMKVLSDYRKYRERVHELERFFSGLNEDATDQELHAAFDEKWDLYLKTEALSGEFRKIEVAQGLRGMGVPEDKIKEATEEVLAVFDLTRTVGRMRCPRKQ